MIRIVSNTLTNKAADIGKQCLLLCSNINQNNWQLNYLFEVILENNAKLLGDKRRSFLHAGPNFPSHYNYTKFPIGILLAAIPGSNHSISQIKFQKIFLNLIIIIIT